MLNDRQRETVRDYFKRNPDATPQDIERLLGFKMDMATVIETGLLKIETADGDGGSGSGTGNASEKVKIEKLEAGDMEQAEMTFTAEMAERAAEDMEKRAKRKGGAK